MNTSDLRTIQITRHFDANAERVFDAWLDPVTAGHWRFATPSREMKKVEIDAKVGGHFVFIDRRDGEDVEHIGQYLDMDRPCRLAFIFAVPKYASAYTRVTLDIERIGTGSELTLTHESVLPAWAEPTTRG